MRSTTRFILNAREVETAAPAGLLVLDFLRNSERLTGTKEGCKEGDCGACAILIGELQGDAVRYQPVTSCLVPLAEVHGKHVVTIEGCNVAGLNPVQEAIVEFGGTQCGFCTPGIVVSLHGLLLDNAKGLSLDDVKYALSGHLCRCTGYRSLKDCAATLERDLGSRLQANGSASRVPALTAAGALPEYFSTIPERLSTLLAANRAAAARGPTRNGRRPFACGGRFRRLATAAAGAAHCRWHGPVRTAGRDDPRAACRRTGRPPGAERDPQGGRRIPYWRPHLLRGVRHPSRGDRSDSRHCIVQSPDRLLADPQPRHPGRQHRQRLPDRRLHGAAAGPGCACRAGRRRHPALRSPQAVLPRLQADGPATRRIAHRGGFR